MSSNPMQRKVRNSFLLGVLSVLIIFALVGAMVFLLVIKPKMDKKKQEKEQIYANVYRLKMGNEVKSGGDITSDMVEMVQIPITTNGTDFITNPSELEKFIETETGKTVIQNRYKSKVDLKEGTILTTSMLYEDDEIKDSLRYVEYNMITMPTTVTVGDFIDIRLRLPNLQDLIVISKKQIMNIYGKTVGLNLTEEEILILNSAIVESYKMTSSELYLAMYIEPGIQEASIYTYSPSADIVDLIKANPNIVATARDDIAHKYEVSGLVRNPINNTLNQYAEDAKENVESGMQQQIQSAIEARESYLSEMEGY